jgi:putative ABC transport system permease protein
MSRRIRAAARLVGVWLRAAPSTIAVLVAVVALTSFLATGAPLWFEKSSQTALASLLASAPAGGSGLEFERSGQIGPGTGDPLADVVAQGDGIRADLPGSIVGGVRPPFVVVDSQPFLAIGPPQPITHLTLRIQPAAMDGIRFYAGRVPSGQIGFAPQPDDITSDFVTPVYEIALSRTTAGVLKLAVGDQLNLTNGSARTGGSIEVVVAGLFDVIDPADPRWFGDATLDQPGIQQLSQERFDYHAIGLLVPDAYTPLVIGPPFENLRYRWRFVLDPGRVASVGVDRFALDLAKLRAAFPFGTAVGVDTPGLSTSLSPLLDLYRSQRAIAATAVTLASVGAIVASGGALALIAAALSRRRAGTIRLARARGADLRRLLAIAVLEALVLVVPAAIVGAVAAHALVGGVAGDASGIAIVGAVAAVLLVAAGLGAARSSLASGRQRSDRTTDARNRRRVFDALVVVVAVGTVVALRSGGTPDPAAPPEPTRAAAPALLAIAGAIVLLRVFDGLVAGLARVARRGRGFVGIHAIRSLARGPRTHELPLLVLLVAVASGVFATTVATTIERTQDLAAASEVGADFRIEAVHGGVLPTNLDLAALAAIGPTAVDGRDVGTLLGIGYAGQAVDVIGLDAPGYAAVTAGTPIAAAYPPGFLTATPADGSPGRPVPIVVAPKVASDTGLQAGSIVRLAMGTTSATVVVVGVGDPVPAAALGRGIVAPIDALRIAFPDRAFGATQAFVHAAPTARPAIEAVLQPYRAGLLVVALTDVRATLRTTPLVDTMTSAFLLAQLVAALYAAVVVGTAVAQALATRSAEMSLLRAIGLPGAQAVSIVVVELGSTVLVALLGGLGLGLATAVLVVPGLGIERFVGAAVSAPTAVDPSGIALAVLAPAVAGLAAVLVVGRALGRSNVAEWIRSAAT